MITRLLDYIAFAFLRTIVFVLEVLPARIAFKVARFYVAILFCLIPRLKKVALKNLQIVFPEKSVAEHLEILAGSKDVLAENILGFARIPTLNKEKAAKMCDYTAASATLEDLYQKHPETGVIIPTLHFDAFEFFIQVHALNHRPVSILGRGFGLPVLDRWWNARREVFGNQIFSRAGGYKEMTRRLKNGEDLVILCDQNVKGSHAVFVDFFGLKAATTKAVALAALRTGAPIMLGCPVQKSPGVFDVTAQEILHPKDVDGTMDEKLSACMEDLHRKFEQQILKRPEAWFWIHRRWKTRPHGEPETVYL